MIIEHITLTNWGPHKNLVIDSNCNIAGIIGENGKGKSNLLQAIDFALTGNLKNNQEAYIYADGSDYAPKSASVRVAFRQQGKQGVITRTIARSGSKRELQWDGQTLTKAVEVDRLMETILGADKAAVSNAVFIKQGEFDKLIKGTPAVRQEIFQKLMNLNFVNARVADINSKIEKLQKGLTDWQPTIDALNQTLATQREQCATVEAQIAGTPDYRVQLQAVQQYLEWLSKYEAKGQQLDTTKAQFARSMAALELDVEEFDQVIQRQESANRAQTESACAIQAASAQLQISSRKQSTLLATSTQLNSHLASLNTHITNYPVEWTEVRLAHTRDSLNQVHANRLQVLQAHRDQEVYELTVNKLENARMQLTQTTAERDRCELQRDKATLEFQTLEAEYNQTMTALQTQLATANLRVQMLELAARIDPKDSTTCPVCGSGCAHVTEDQVLAARVAAAELTKAINATTAEFSPKRSELRNIEQAYQAAVLQVSTAQNLCTYLEGEVGQLTTPANHITAEERAQVQAQLTAELNTLQAEIDNGTRIMMQQNTIIAGIAQALSALTMAQVLDAAILTPVDTSRQGYQTCASMVSLLLGTILDHQANQVLTHERELEAAQTARGAVLAECNALQNASQRHEELVAITQSLQEQEAQLTAEPGYSTMVSYIEAVLPAEEPQDITSNLLREVIALYTERNSARAQLVGYLDACKRAIADSEASLAHTQAQMQKDATKRRLISDLQTLARLVNKNGVPLAYMNSVFHSIAEHVAVLLQRMEAKFTVVPDPERPITFKFMLLDNPGHMMPQELLSGGQSMRLALALLIACQQSILPEVGLLVLDEPTTHIDTAGKESMRNMFMSMASMFNSSEAQIIVVDHAEILQTAFERIKVL